MVFVYPNFGSFVAAMLKYQARNTKPLLLGLSMHRKIIMDKRG